MEKSNYFKNEINSIQDIELQSFVKYYLDEYVPNYFWEIGASSSGKYHPQFSQGVGGLVRHTKAVVLFAQELLRMSPYAYLSDTFKDYVLVACIVHDTAKYGYQEYDKSAYQDHALNARLLVERAWGDFFGYPHLCPIYLLDAIESHMGQWGSKKPFNNIDRCVHMADYMASRSFIDIPQVNDEYLDCRCEQESEGKLPLASIGGQYVETMLKCYGDN